MTIATLLFALIATTNTGDPGQPTLLDFHASWCGPCQQMRPAVKELVRKGYPVKSIDVDQSPELAGRYKVSAVPTFIVVDGAGRAHARVEGLQPAAKLASLYRETRAKLRSKSASSDAADEQVAQNDDDEPEKESTPAEEEKASTPVNPKPWETVVRIRIDGQGMIGYGSGTIIASTPKESIILTCAHIFHVEGQRQVHPSRFPNRIIVDMFDGNLRVPGRGEAGQVHYANESFDGEAIDYDFNLDVGLIRIRPGRRLPASRVVPSYWTPRPRMQMTTVGCSEGHDATAWSTSIINPRLRNALPGRSDYEAIECWFAPKQGRSGGGLFTQDGYIAGVCDFAEPAGNHGLYAAPSSIYRLLDRNRLSALYAPPSRQGGTLLASTGPRPKRRAPARVARAQSPDHDDSGEVKVPPPELLGIASPGEPTRAAAGSKSRRTAWHPPTPKPLPPAAEQLERTEETDIKLSPEVGGAGFDEEPESTPAPAADESVSARPKARVRSGWRPARTAASSLAPMRDE